MIHTITSFLPNKIFSFPVLKKPRFSFYSPYKNEFEGLTGRISKDSAYIVSDKDRKIIKDALKKCAPIPSDISADAFYKILSPVMNESTDKDLRKFLGSLSENQLLSLAGLDTAKREGMIETQASMKDIALKSVLKTKGSALWREFAPEFVDLFHHFMNIIISMLSLNEIGPSNVHNSFEAQFKFQTYTTIIGYLAVVFGIIYAAVGSLAIALPATITVLAVSVVALFIYTRYFRRAPIEVTPMTNLTRQVIKTDEPPVFPRHELLSQIKNQFQSGKGVLLIGEPGCGKSSLVKALAQSMADGEIDFLKDTQLFEANAGTLGGMGELSLTVLEEIFRNHRKKVVFFLDEIHALFKENSTLQVSQKDILKTFCDKFPYTIIATTQKEYDDLIDKPENEAFLRRFGSKPIHIPPYSKDEMEAILKKQLHTLAPELIWDASVITAIAEKANVFSPNTAQVDAAFSLLKLLVVKATVLSTPTLDKEISDLRMQIDCIQIDLLNHYDETAGEKHKELQNLLQEKEKELKAKKHQLKQINKVESQFVAAKQQSYLLADKAKNPATKKKWLENHVFSTILERHIQDQRASLGLPGKLNIDLVDKVIQEKHS